MPIFQLVCIQGQWDCVRKLETGLAGVESEKEKKTSPDGERHQFSTTAGED